MVAALQFFEFLPVFEFEALLVVTAFIRVLVLNADESVILGREEVSPEVGGREGVVAILTMPDLVHCVGLIFVGGGCVLLLRVIDCHVFSGLVCSGRTVGEVLDFSFSWELEFFCGCFWRAEDELVLEELHNLVVCFF